MNQWHKFLPVCLLAAIFMGLAGCGGVQIEERRVEFSAQTLQRLRVTAPGAKVTLHAGAEEPYALLTMREYGPYLGGETRLLCDETEEGITAITMEQKRNLGFGAREASLEIHLPKAVVKRLEADVGSGSLGCRDFLFDTLEVQATSGSVRLERVAASEMKFIVSSGDIELADCAAGLANAKMNSGNFDGRFTNDMTDLYATAGSGTVDAVGSFVNIMTYVQSGKIAVESKTLPQQIVCEVSSGSARIRVPDMPQGFTVAYETNSGSFETTFAEEYDRQKGSFTCGEGTGDFRFLANSGSLSLSRRMQ